MIDASLRRDRIVAEANDPSVAVLLLDYRDDPPGRELGHRDGGDQEPEGDDPEQKQEDVFGPGPEGCRPAGPEEQGARQPRARRDCRQVEQASHGQLLATIVGLLT